MRPGGAYFDGAGAASLGALAPEVDSALDSLSFFAFSFFEELFLDFSSLDAPEAPDAPDVLSDVPEAPDALSLSLEVPDAPDVLSDVPDAPEEPMLPDEPDEPEAPDEPDEPMLPEEPDEPEAPDEPDESILPDEPDEPEVPDEPDEPMLPEEPEAPDDLSPLPPLVPAAASLPGVEPDAPVVLGEVVDEEEPACARMIGSLSVTTSAPAPAPCASTTEDADANTTNESDRIVVFNVMNSSLGLKEKHHRCSSLDARLAASFSNFSSSSSETDAKP